MAFLPLRRWAWLSLAPLLLGLGACATDLPFLGPTPTPTVTPTFTPSPTPTFTPTPTPSPTPPPAARIAAADDALYAGDWDAAAAGYQAVLAAGASVDADRLAAAQLGLGKAWLYGGHPQAAAQAFAKLSEQFPDSGLAADAAFLQGEAFRALGQWPQAIESYRRYQQLRPAGLNAYVEERVAQTALASGDLPAAVTAYTAALAAPRLNGAPAETLELRENLAAVYLRQGALALALDQYDQIFRLTDQDWRKARARVLAGDALYAAGQREAAYAKYQDAVNGYPAAGDTFPALKTLVADGVRVDDLQRALTNYHAQNYAPALAAFDRVLAANPADTTALYYRGLTLNALDRPADALAAFRELVERFPGDAHWQPAYYQIAFIQDYPADTATFETFAAVAPQDPQAPDALYRAARLAERHADLAHAAQLWERLAQTYPAADQAADALLQAGVALFRAGQIGPAARDFEKAAGQGNDPAQHARAWLWIGKAKARQGDLTAARTAWVKAAALDPGGYYSLRAAQLARGELPFAAPARLNFRLDADAERRAAEAWLRATFPAAQAVSDLSGLGAGLYKDMRFQRGAELWRLGLLREAHAEFDALRLDLQGDPIAMWQLANYWNSLGAYDLAIRAARRVLDLAGETDLTQGPLAVQRLRFPAPFIDRITTAGAQYGPAPFLMLAKMRLESFFWKYAFSSAEARGLNQIIPATAEDIARKLQLTDFQLDDLYRPAVSIPMGAYYLAYVGQSVNGGPAAQLAGYYAGPGNAQAWLDLAGGDPDLFVEVIRLPDAKGYVQTAYEYFAMYTRLYSAP